MTTVREQLAEWGIEPEAVLDLEMDPVPPPSVNPHVSAQSDGRIMQIRVLGPEAIGPMGARHTRERERLADRHAAERRAANPG